jgi:hypothetical protein
VRSTLTSTSPLWRKGALAAVLLLGGCVVPVAPEFQDPPASQNYAPYILDSDPALGAIATATTTTDVTFNVTVSDPNVGDALTVRWILDYPPYSANTRAQQDETLAPATDGQVHERTLPPFRPDCVLSSLAKIPSHQVMVVVSDRGFLPVENPGAPSTDLTRIPDDGHKVTGTWTLDVDCTQP